MRKTAPDPSAPASSAPCSVQPLRRARRSAAPRRFAARKPSPSASRPQRSASTRSAPCKSRPLAREPVSMIACKRAWTFMCAPTMYASDAALTGEGLLQTCRARFDEPQRLGPDRELDRLVLDEMLLDGRRGKLVGSLQL